MKDVKQVNTKNSEEVVTMDLKRSSFLVKISQAKKFRPI